MKPHIPIPPRLATQLLHRFIREDLREEVTGDLQENFEYRLQSGSRRIAQFNYWIEVLHYLRPFALRKIKNTHSNPSVMYKSYFKTALRGMVRNKLHAFINISGLAAGTAVAFIIGLWIHDEMSYEKGFPNYERVAQVIQNVTNNGEVETWTNVPYPLAAELRSNYSQDFTHIVNTSGAYNMGLATEENKFSKRGLFAEPDFAKVFSLNMISGASNALNDKSSILISASAATAYYGDKDPIGKIMTLAGEMTVHVGGVYADLPDHSDLAGIDFVAPWDLFFTHYQLSDTDDPWRPNGYTLYVQLADHATFEGASSLIKDAKLKKISTELAKKKPELFLHPMKDWHLNSEFKNGKHAAGRMQYVWMFGIVGMFVLLMACINFMNLSTARSEKRAKEVGIRRAAGSYRGQLIGQFFSESILTAFISVLAALMLAGLILPFFNSMAEKQMSIPWGEPALWAASAVISILIGLVAGSYPALYLSSINSVGAMKGAFKAGTSASLPRKVLVVLQFSISVIMIIGTVTVFLQIRHGKNRPMGYETNGLISIQQRSEEIHKHYDAIREELISSRAIVEMAESVVPPTSSWASTSRLVWTGKDPNLSVDFGQFGGSVDYGKTIGWEIIAGRDFSRDFPSDSAAFIINETAVAQMGLKNPIGEVVRWGGDPYTIIGVVRNMIYQNPYEPVRPSLYFLTKEGQRFLVMRLNPATSPNEALASIETVIKKHSEGEAFSYQFLDEAYARKFSSEERIGTLASVFAALAIFISSLGIFGLSSFIAEQRTKEIGLRKVLGASLTELWLLMSRDFVFLVIVSCIIAVPLAWVLLDSWLEGYAYRVALPWWTFAAATIGTLLITIVTVSWHTIHAAKVNPVNSLRAE